MRLSILDLLLKIIFEYSIVYDGYNNRDDVLI